MKIFIGTDHAGFELKEHLVLFLREQGHYVEDIGAYTFQPLDDYPDFVRSVAEAVVKNQDSRGIIIGGSGQGEAMTSSGAAILRRRRASARGGRARARCRICAARMHSTRRSHGAAPCWRCRASSTSRTHRPPGR